VLGLIALGGSVAVTLALPACSGASSVPLGAADASSGSSSGGSSSGGSSGGGSGSSGGGSGSSSGTSGGSSGSSSGGQGQDAGCTTTVHGTVWDPGKVHPVFNAVVYVPSTTLGGIVSGPTCDPCTAPPSGNPVAVTLSGPDGKFSLSGVPAGVNVPIVVQVGKWRREGVVIPTVTACADTAVDADLTRLPKNQSEGHLPHIAISTGLDSVECALQSMGVDPVEFTASTGAGRIHLYQGSTTSGATAGTATAAASTLWASTSLMGQYDMIIDACQGAAPTDKPEAAIQNLNAFAAAGGRVYLSHYENFAIWPPATSGETSAWSPTGTQDPNAATSAITTAANVPVDLGFPKGGALAKWAQSVGASTQQGQISMLSNSRTDVLGANPPARAWLSGDVSGMFMLDGGPTSEVYQYSFYAGASACGKVHYADYHVSAGTQTAGLAFPTECPTAGPDAIATDLFEFFLFDALACTQDDSQPPQTPPL
jgi:hypothetical protein